MSILYPSAGTSGQVWTSDGDGAGSWSVQRVPLYLVLDRQ